jgi:paraquat-inducible protein B
MLIIAAMFGVYEIEARIADKAQSKADIAVAHAADLEKQNATFQAQTQAQIALLQAQLSARGAKEVSIPPANRVLTAPQVAQQIAATAKVPEATVTSTSDTVTFPLPLAQTALTDMQLVPLLMQDKSDLQKSLDLEKAAHASDIQACQIQSQAQNATIAAIKKRNRTTVIKAFFVGVVVGFIGRGAL